MIFPRRTWDGEAIAAEPPYGAMVVAIRGREFLVLRRVAAENGHGDWLWTPPSGARRPGEPIDACAMRELYEETGLSGLAPQLVGGGEWHVYRVEVPGEAQVHLDIEHSEYRWVSLEEAMRLCRPQVVADGLEQAWEAIR